MLFSHLFPSYGLRNTLSRHAQAKDNQSAENSKLQDKLDEIAADLYLEQQEVEKLSAENAALKQEQDSRTAVCTPASAC